MQHNKAQYLKLANIVIQFQQTDLNLDDEAASDIENFDNQT